MYNTTKAVREFFFFFLFLYVTRPSVPTVILLSLEIEKPVTVTRKCLENICTAWFCDTETEQSLHFSSFLSIDFEFESLPSQSSVVKS